MTSCNNNSLCLKCYINFVLCSSKRMESSTVLAMLRHNIHTLLKKFNKKNINCDLTTCFHSHNPGLMK